MPKKRFNQYTFANTNLKINDHESYYQVFLVQKYTLELWKLKDRFLVSLIEPNGLD